MAPRRHFQPRVGGGGLASRRCGWTASVDVIANWLIRAADRICLERMTAGTSQAPCIWPDGPGAVQSKETAGRSLANSRSFGKKNSYVGSAPRKQGGRQKDDRSRPYTSSNANIVQSVPPPPRPGAVPAGVVLPSPSVPSPFPLSLHLIVLGRCAARGRRPRPAPRPASPPTAKPVLLAVSPPRRAGARMAPAVAVVPPVLAPCSPLRLLSAPLFPPFRLAPPPLLLLRVHKDLLRCARSRSGRHTDRIGPRSCAARDGGGARLGAGCESPVAKTGASMPTHGRRACARETATHNAAAKASASCSLTFLISSSRAARVCVTSRLYQWTSLFFCHRPVGALMLWPR